MTAIVYEIDGIWYYLRNFLEFSESYSEETNKFSCESGHTYVYPLQNGGRKHKISLKIEANSEYLKVLRKIFSQTEISLTFFHDSANVSTDAIGNVKRLPRRETFVKSGDYKVEQIVPVDTAIRNHGMYCVNGCGGAYDRYGRGAFEFSVTLETTYFAG